MLRCVCMISCFLFGFICFFTISFEKHIKSNQCVSVCSTCVSMCLSDSIVVVMCCYMIVKFCSIRCSLVDLFFEVVSLWLNWQPMLVRLLSVLLSRFSGVQDKIEKKGSPWKTCLTFCIWFPMFCFSICSYDVRCVHVVFYGFVLVLYDVHLMFSRRF